MEYLIALFYLILSLHCIHMMVKKGEAYYIPGILGLFSIGYYILPIMFKEFSRLDRFTSYNLSIVSLMGFLFFLAFYVGYRFFLAHSKNYSTSISFGVLDVGFNKYILIIFWLAVVLWWTYVLNVDITSYQAENSKTYFLKRDAFSGLLSYISGFSIAIIAVCAAKAYSDNNFSRFLWMTFVFLISLTPLMLTAQRLAVIAPLFTFMAALGLLGAHKMALRMALISILVLLIISPLMVYAREFRGSAGVGSTFQGLMSYESGRNNYLETAFGSIMDRADLLFVMIRLKNLFDNQDAPGLIYYLSIFSSYIPGSFWPDKPYPLSDDGTIYGEISVLAWSTINSRYNLGSLTAFGSIVAYREGGWLWLPINGFLVGALSALIYTALGKGSIISKIFFCVLFPLIAIKNVPPSFFSLIVMISTTILVLTVLKGGLLLLPYKKK